MDYCRATCANGKPCSCHAKHGDYCGKHKKYSITHTIRHPLFNNNIADILRRVIDKKDELWMSGFYCFICRHYNAVIFNQQKAASAYIYFKQFTNNIAGQNIKIYGGSICRVIDNRRGDDQAFETLKQNSVK